MKSMITSARLTLASLFILTLLSFKCGGAHADTPAATAPPVSVESILSEKQFNTLFPQRDKFYSYAAFIKAVKELSAFKIKIVKRAYSALQLSRIDNSIGKATIIREDKGFNESWAKSKPDSVYYIDFAKFCTEKDALTNKKELAAFFAHIAHETRHGQNGQYNDGLMLKHENDTSLPYIADNDEYPPAAGKKYYGRGPMQLSYNGNYGYASDCIFGDKKVLLNNPDLVETDPVVAFKTAIYFWMTPQAPKPSAHAAMTGSWQPNDTEKAKGRIPGFGSTINIINGAIECGKGDDMYNMKDRIGFYQHFLTQLGTTDSNCACSCGKMAAY
ncbi:hypothetical protein GCM10023149_52990 [Mucilaginibacter gynuensis]|uniref:Glycoside hydrolase family 19 catalytic domain-containing protein n=1 Tax=Mucilaginibacter gynuensis TaxID=1302236 RepID=A0ABP8HM58_9SPHI